MLLARVVGTVVSTCKVPSLDGLKLLLLEGTSPAGEGKASFVVAADGVGAGLGDLVLYASGSSARQTPLTSERPVDAVVMGIVDLVEEQGVTVYSKQGEATQ